jgi:hypothetical protein
MEDDEVWKNKKRKYYVLKISVKEKVFNIVFV